MDFLEMKGCWVGLQRFRALKTARLFILAALLASFCGFGAFAVAHLTKREKSLPADQEANPTPISLPQGSEPVTLSEAERATRCIADFREHDPVKDADHDIARDDVTPLGRTFVPDIGEPATTYDGVCTKRYEPSKPTGKWFPRPARGWISTPHSPEYEQCERAAGQYFIKYNRRMVQEAPGAMRAFCESQKLNADERMALASDAVFGAHQIAKVGVYNMIAETIAGVPYATDPHFLVDTAWGPALITRSV